MCPAGQRTCDSNNKKLIRSTSFSTCYSMRSTSTLTALPWSLDAYRSTECVTVALYLFAASLGGTAPTPVVFHIQQYCCVDIPGLLAGSKVLLNTHTRTRTRTRTRTHNEKTENEPQQSLYTVVVFTLHILTSTRYHTTPLFVPSLEEQRSLLLASPLRQYQHNLGHALLSHPPRGGP